MAARLRDINPHIHVTARAEFLDPDSAAALAQSDCCFIVDAIDSIAPKEDLITAALAAGKRIISSMGAGGKLDPSRVRIADISATHNDRMARLLRKNLRRRAGVQSGVPCVFSCEPVTASSMAEVDEVQRFKRSFYGTMSYLPALFGLHMAAYVICELAGKQDALQYPPTPCNAAMPPSRRNAALGQRPFKQWRTGPKRPTEVEPGERVLESRGSDRAVYTRASRQYPWGDAEAPGLGIGFDGAEI